MPATARRWLRALLVGRYCAVFKFAAPLYAVLGLGIATLGAIAICGADAGEAWARAGGGQGYSGGAGGHGGGTGGGFGGGGGGLDIGPLVYWFFWFCTTYPFIALPLVCLFVYLFLQASRQGADSYRTSVIRRAGGQLADELRDTALARIEAVDPQFDEAAFCRRAADAFLKLQAAWGAQDLAPVQPFVSDGIYERFALQFAEQRDFNYRNQFDQIEIREVRLVQAAGDACFDLLSVALRAQGDDYRVALDTGQRLSAGATRAEFVEYWTFLRRRGVVTADRPGLIEGQCPNCGAAIELNESTRCSSCNSLVRSGQFDWVLVEITQDSEWRDDEPPEPPGAAEFRRHDPGFNVKHLEDRASVIFWRKTMADRLGRTRPLEKMALPDFCQQYSQGWEAPAGERHYWGDCAVGSVETVGLLPGTPFDRALIEVRWSGWKFVVRAGEKPRSIGETALIRTLLVLCRKPGVRSSVEMSITSAHCPQCGAPESDLAADACEFCGAVLNDGSYDWVLGAMHAIPSAEAAALRDEVDRAPAAGAVFPAAAAAAGLPQVAGPAPEIQSPVEMPRSRELLAWAVQMALVDQQLDERERAALTGAAARRGVAPSRLEALITAAQNGKMVVPQPHDREEAETWLSAMADLALADGRVEEPEARLLIQTGQQMGYSRADIRMLFARRKALLYRAAREQLRQRRNGG